MEFFIGMMVIGIIAGVFVMTLMFHSPYSFSELVATFGVVLPCRRLAGRRKQHDVIVMCQQCGQVDRLVNALHFKDVCDILVEGLLQLGIVLTDTHHSSHLLFHHFLEVFEVGLPVVAPRNPYDGLHDVLEGKPSGVHVLGPRVVVIHHTINGSNVFLPMVDSIQVTEAELDVFFPDLQCRCF